MTSEDDFVSSRNCFLVLFFKPTGNVVVTIFESFVQIERGSTTHSCRRRLEIDIFKPITQTGSFCSTETKHNHALVVVDKFQHFSIAVYKTCRLPVTILHAGVS
jgi:hypothetical protein